MSRRDWRSISIEDAAELESQLISVLRLGAIRRIGKTEIYGKKLAEKCRQALSAVLPLNTAEMEFLNLLA